jgi:catechol 2,3-dioxygenase-like lactoylglutathione lyase family enzyme
VSGAPAIPGIAVDHLVVACRSLAEGRAWCEATLGVEPLEGGRHSAMGTHNLLLALSSARFPRAYLELIAIDPDAVAPARARWFDLDDTSLQAAIAEPRLVSWVARTDDIDVAVAALRDAGHHPGRVVDAERMSARGLLRWRITLPEDGRRAAAGALPLWIQWRGEHPSAALAARGVALESVRIAGLEPELAALLEALVDTDQAGPPLTAVLATPRGRVALAAPAPLSRQSVSA